MKRINSKHIAILGANGLLGADLVTNLQMNYVVTPITKQNYDEHKGKSFDVFINANGNSKRFWAIQNVLEDFEVSTNSVYKTMFDFKFKKYIYISSVDVYPDPSSPKRTQEDPEIKVIDQNPYGFHKYLSEQIVKKNVSDWLILRPSIILGSNLKKGPIYDITNDKPLFVTISSKLQVITTDAIAKVIETLLKKSVKNEIINVGGVGALSFSKLHKFFNKKILVSPEAKPQVYEMNIKKLQRLCPILMTSEEYLREFLLTTNRSDI
jgi:dTDP-4-dehydrorhamnose reductase